jgi:hypothetical protein
MFRTIKRHQQRNTRKKGTGEENKGFEIDEE